LVIGALAFGAAGGLAVSDLLASLNALATPEANRECIGACNPENIAALISTYKEMQQKLLAHDLAG